MKMRGESFKTLAERRTEKIRELQVQLDERDAIIKAQQEEIQRLQEIEKFEKVYRKDLSYQYRHRKWALEQARLYHDCSEVFATLWEESLKGRD